MRVHSLIVLALAGLLAPAAPTWAQSPRSKPRPTAEATPEPSPTPTAEPDTSAAKSDDETPEEPPAKHKRRRHRDKGDVSFGGHVHVGSGETHEEDIVVMGGSVDIEGKQKGDVVAMGGHVKVSGEVDGDTVVIGGTLDLQDTASVSGDAVVVGGTLNKEDGASVEGKTVNMGHFKGMPDLPDFSYGLGLRHVFLMSIVAWLKTALAALLISLLIAAVLPARTEAAGLVLRERWLACLGTGLLTWIVAIVVTPILCLTCIGAVVPFVFYQVAKYFGFAVLFAVVGQALGRTGLGRDLTLLPALLVGFLVLSLIGLIVPFVWWIYGWLGVGLAVTTKFGAMQPWFRPRGPLPPAVPGAPLATPPSGDVVA
jgi:hypothetical protein